MRVKSPPCPTTAMTCSGRAVIHCLSMSTRSSRSYSVAVAHQTSGSSSMPWISGAKHGRRENGD